MTNNPTCTCMDNVNRITGSSWSWSHGSFTTTCAISAYHH